MTPRPTAKSKKNSSSSKHIQEDLIDGIASILKKVKGSSDRQLGETISKIAVRRLLSDVRALFSSVLEDAGVSPRTIVRMMTKFQDAGRRSPPWQPGSSRGAFRRPQDGADGNRKKRWFFPRSHKFYASEVVGTMVEVKFYFQTLSMKGAPRLPNSRLRDLAVPLLGHPMEPGRFIDPISRLPVKFSDFVDDRRAVESGHLIPLGNQLRGVRGRHNVVNATLMLRDSNRIQADMNMPDLMDMLQGILQRHGYRISKPSRKLRKRRRG